MKIEIDWQKPLTLTKDFSQEVIQELIAQVRPDPGLYIFGRIWNNKLSPLYVGQATSVTRRLKQQLNNHRLIESVGNAKIGRRVIVVGYLQPDGRRSIGSALAVAEKAFIRHFVAEGHDLHNKLGTTIKRHEIASIGTKYRGVVPNCLMVETVK